MGCRIAVGTAQFGLNYGVANEAGQVLTNDVMAILDMAATSGIDTLDTAIAYGNSEAVLGNAGVSAWRIVTKVPRLPSDLENCEAWVESQASASLLRLKLSRLDGLLLHNACDLIGPNGRDCLRALQKLRENGTVKSVGVSIYTTAELDGLWPVFRPDLVQAPFNVLDRRLETSGWLARLAGEGVRVHTRSAFLQGLLLMPPEKRPSYFQPWNTLLNGWNHWCNEAGVTPLAAALGFCLGYLDIERVVVGVDSLKQLAEILEAANLNVPSPPATLCSKDRAFIEPSQWKL